MKAQWTTLAPILSVAAALGIAACGAERDSSQPMTQGEQITLDSGCTGCHGANGQGGAGPTWKGLYQSDVELNDGSTVVADDAYLAESIVDPTAKQVKGFGLMPANSLDDAEVQAVVDYIKSLEKLEA